MGNKVTNDSTGIMKQDVKEKRARFIDRSNELQQEFSFAHPRTKFFLNQIYNTHFYGSPLWDLSSHEIKLMENTWNVSVRKVFGLPRDSHRYFVESVSEFKHLRTIIVERYLKFCHEIRKSKKIALKNVFQLIETDTKSVTGSNLIPTTSKSCLHMKQEIWNYVLYLNKRDGELDSYMN